ncbi:MAG: hypothetical protein ABIV51_09685, partial [Saprospiraceae bacterium]
MQRRPEIPSIFAANHFALSLYQPSKLLKAIISSAASCHRAASLLAIIFCFICSISYSQGSAKMVIFNTNIVDVLEGKILESYDVVIDGT